jgi:hypothetical protein
MVRNGPLDFLVGHGGIDPSTKRIKSPWAAKIPTDLSGFTELYRCRHNYCGTLTVLTSEGDTFVYLSQIRRSALAVKRRLRAHRTFIEAAREFC